MNMNYESRLKLGEQRENHRRKYYKCLCEFISLLNIAMACRLMIICHYMCSVASSYVGIIYVSKENVRSVHKL